MKTENLVTVTEYAILCGVTGAAIRSRVNNGTIEGFQIEGNKTAAIFIDITKFPPQKTMKSGRKPFKR